MVHCFASTDAMGYNPDEDTQISLGLTGYLFNERPSALFGWDDPEDWHDRLVFDMRIANLIWQKVIFKAMQNGRTI